MSEDVKQAKFEGWAVIELMGHQQEVGYVTTEAYGQAVLFRVDVPEQPGQEQFVLDKPTFVEGEWTHAGATVRREGRPARSRLVAPGAIYALNPCTETAARRALERLIDRPLILIEAPPAKVLAATLEIDHRGEDDGEDDAPF